MKILIAGDYCPKDRVASIIESGEYDSVFIDIQSVVGQSDYSIINFECPVVEHNATPIAKCGPHLKCTSKAVQAIKFAGFDCVTLANNHFYDYGEIGVQDTIQALTSNGMDYVGGGKNLTEASRILFKEINGEKLAIINCCEHEFSISSSSKGGSNPLNVIQQYYSIQEAKNNADFVIVIVHGGFEHFQLPCTRMVESYRFFIDAGADAVINHHQHCYSGYETYNGKPIFYGLGNFCFDWEGKRDAKWNYGYMVSLDLSNTVSYDIHPYVQCNDAPKVVIIDDNSDFHKNLQQINQIIANPILLENSLDSYLDRESTKYTFCFEPFLNKFTQWFYRKGLLPSFLKRRRVIFQDYFGNESHYEKVMYLINK